MVTRASQADEVRGRFEIRLRGQLSERTRRALADYLDHADDVDTVLSGFFHDTANLICLLERIDELGLDLIEARRIRDAS